ncbi:DUF3038 domain-containing protein [Lusitaniella coriacea LEGE 07157]|uniref:DUF3038 domain-containing protein n=1 Tax=Lusitaniella coriacea LEGE 07157 TaxID=945747 RepID=A0A8J7DYM6_9CYAN|nr:DUF3038 domain-containing protein [Lusitaniella coriacea]MBE9117921.1 DUF3038 domain-containing protein [Lusitaniella coriacea LEGE 07157]
MNDSVSVMPNQSSSVPSAPLVLDNLPDPPMLDRGCSLRMKQRIDLILLALEALELGGSEEMLATARELGLNQIVKNRVILWRLRCMNPWRRAHVRSAMTLSEAKALVIIASYRSRQLTVPIRQLLLAEQQIREKGLPLEQHFRLSEYLERFRAHFRSRMNPRRARVTAYNSDDRELNELALSLLGQLLFCTGTSGMQRFWIGLFDGEVA